MKVLKIMVKVVDNKVIEVEKEIINNKKSLYENSDLGGFNINEVDLLGEDDNGNDIDCNDFFKDIDKGEFINENGISLIFGGYGGCWEKINNNEVWVEYFERIYFKNEEEFNKVNDKIEY